MKLTKSGHESMFMWNKSWRPHHLPLWAKKAIRLTAIRNGTWDGDHWNHLQNDLFDHWGTVEGTDGVRVLIAQPYGNHDEMAQKFASEHGLSLVCLRPGPWHEGTFLYEFKPLKIEQRRKHLQETAR